MCISKSTQTGLKTSPEANRGKWMPTNYKLYGGLVWLQLQRGGIDDNRCVGAYDRRPFARPPGFHHAVLHVRIVFGEVRGDRGRIAAKQQHRAVGRVGERATEDQLVARNRLQRVFEVRLAKGGAAREVVVGDG